jgi:sugar phosphate isomerase/epimerase
MNEASFPRAMAGNARSETASKPLQRPVVEPAASESREVAWMRRLSINHLTTPRWSLEEDLERYADEGVSGIGINWQKLNDDAIPRDVERIRDAKLGVSSVGWSGGFTGGTGLTFREAMFDARRKLRIARQVSAGSLLVITGPQATHIRSHAARLTADALSELCDAAVDSNVRIAVQPMDRLFRRGWSFLHTLEETLELLDRVGCQRAGICFGTYHLWQEPGLTKLVREVASRISLVQLSDWREPPRCENDRALPGDGCIPLKEIVRSLEEAGYDGWYELELWSRDLWKQDHLDLIQTCVRRYQALQSE